MANKSLGPDLLVVGELNMDLILGEVESFPELGKDKIAGDMELTLGSSSAIFAANIARLGVTTEFCGMVGDDDFGAHIIQQLQEYDIDTSFVKVDPKVTTGLTAIIRFSGDRAMITYPGAMLHLSMKDIPAEAFQKAPHLHISNIFLQPGIKKDLLRILKKAKSNNMTISMDPQWDPEEKWDLDLKKLMRHIDFFFPNEEEFLQLTASASVDEGLIKLKSHDGGCIVVKRGKEGASWLGNNEVHTIPAYINEKAVDAIGAGDSFNAGFIYQFLEGDSIEQCVRFGNLAGAVSTTKAGGTAAISSLENVINIAKNNFSITNLDDFTG